MPGDIRRRSSWSPGFEATIKTAIEDRSPLGAKVSTVKGAAAGASPRLSSPAMHQGDAAGSLLSRVIDSEVGISCDVDGAFSLPPPGWGEIMENYVSEVVRTTLQKRDPSEGLNRKLANLKGSYKSNFDLGPIERLLAALYVINATRGRSILKLTKEAEEEKKLEKKEFILNSVDKIRQEAEKFEDEYQKCLESFETLLNKDGPSPKNGDGLNYLRFEGQYKKGYKNLTNCLLKVMSLNPPGNKLAAIRVFANDYFRTVVSPEVNEEMFRTYGAWVPHNVQLKCFNTASFRAWQKQLHQLIGYAAFASTPETRVFYVNQLLKHIERLVLLLRKEAEAGAPPGGAPGGAAPVGDGRRVLAADDDDDDNNRFGGPYRRGSGLGPGSDIGSNFGFDRQTGGGFGSGSDVGTTHTNSHNNKEDNRGYWGGYQNTIHLHLPGDRSKPSTAESSTSTADASLKAATNNASTQFSDDDAARLEEERRLREQNRFSPGYVPGQKLKSGEEILGEFFPNGFGLPGPGVNYQETSPPWSGGGGQFPSALKDFRFNNDVEKPSSTRWLTTESGLNNGGLLPGAAPEGASRNHHGVQTTYLNERGVKSPVSSSLVGREHNPSINRSPSSSVRKPDSGKPWRSPIYEDLTLATTTSSRQQEQKTSPINNEEKSKKSPTVRSQPTEFNRVVLPGFENPWVTERVQTDLLTKLTSEDRKEYLKNCRQITLRKPTETTEPQINTLFIHEDELTQLRSNGRLSGNILGLNYILMNANMKFYERDGELVNHEHVSGWVDTSKEEFHNGWGTPRTSLFSPPKDPLYRSLVYKKNEPEQSS